MSTPRRRRTETLPYVIGYGLSLLLTSIAFGLVWQHVLSGHTALFAVLGLGLAQILVHFRCFLHIDLRRNSLPDLQLLLFSSMIIALMVGGTLVVLINLHSRMMGP